MYIIDTATKEIVAEIITNHSMTLDEALNLVGDKVEKGYDDDADYIIGGKEYWYEDLDMTNNPAAYFGEED